VGKPSTEDGGTALSHDLLARQLSGLARRLEAEDDPGLMLDEVVLAAVALIPGVEEGSISVVIGRRQVSSRHASGDLPAKVDAVQEETGEGPCLDATYEHQTVRVSDMAHEARWPKFSARALELGAASMLSFQLYVEGDKLGALNLYSRHPNSFDDDSEHIGLLFASHAAIAFADAEKVRHLRIAVSRRDLIGQAKGILMERYKIRADQAFSLLVRVSQDNNCKLYDVAEELTRTGELEGSTTRSDADQPTRGTAPPQARAINKGLAGAPDRRDTRFESCRLPAPYPSDAHSTRP
jgi:GAF domain-containing protein